MKVKPTLLFVSVCSSENANKVMDLIREHDHIGIRTVHIMKSEDMESELLVFLNLFDKTFREKMVKLRKENTCVINSVPITGPSFFRRSYRVNAGKTETVTRLLGPLSDKILQAFVEFLMSQYTAEYLYNIIFKLKLSLLSWQIINTQYFLMTIQHIQSKFIKLNVSGGKNMNKNTNPQYIPNGTMYQIYKLPKKLLKRFQEKITIGIKSGVKTLIFFLV